MFHLQCWMRQDMVARSGWSGAVRSRCLAPSPDDLPGVDCCNAAAMPRRVATPRCLSACGKLAGCGRMVLDGIGHHDGARKRCVGESDEPWNPLRGPHARALWAPQDRWDPFGARRALGGLPGRHARGLRRGRRVGPAHQVVGGRRQVAGQPRAPRPGSGCATSHPSSSSSLCRLPCLQRRRLMA